MRRRQQLPHDLALDELQRELRAVSADQVANDRATQRVLRARHTSEGIDRRRVLQLGGLAAASGVFLAACGEDDTAGTVTVPPRLGDAPERIPLDDPVVNDVVLLRTASSLEYLAIAVYTLVLDEFSDLFTGDAAPLTDVVERFREDHQRHAAATSALTTELGGIPFECPNPRFMDIYVGPAVELIAGTEAARALLGIDGAVEPIAPSDDPLGDLLVFAYGLETLAGATYQSTVPVFTLPSLRRDAMTVGAEEARHASLLARVISPDAIFPVEGEPAAAVPVTFGQLGQILIAIGLPNEVGNKTVLALETPSLNSLIYEDTESC